MPLRVGIAQHASQVGISSRCVPGWVSLPGVYQGGCIPNSVLQGGCIPNSVPQGGYLSPVLSLGWVSLTGVIPRVVNLSPLLTSQVVNLSPLLTSQVGISLPVCTTWVSLSLCVQRWVSTSCCSHMVG